MQNVKGNIVISAVIGGILAVSSVYALTCPLPDTIKFDVHQSLLIAPGGWLSEPIFNSLHGKIDINPTFVNAAAFSSKTGGVFSMSCSYHSATIGGFQMHHIGNFSINPKQNWHYVGKSTFSSNNAQPSNVRGNGYVCNVNVATVNDCPFQIAN